MRHFDDEMDELVCNALMDATDTQLRDEVFNEDMLEGLTILEEDELEEYEDEEY